MAQILQAIDQTLAYVMKVLIRVYQMTLSPDKGILSFGLKWKICCHEPHCSQYAIEVFAKYGFWKGFYKAMDRVFRCRGWYCKIYDPSHYKVVFCSSAPIGVQFLEELQHDPRFEIVWVVTMPDKPAGRWMKIKENIIKSKSKKLFPDHDSVDFIQTPTKLNPAKSEDGKKFHKRLKNKNPDFVIVIAYGKIIPQTILDIPNVAPINVHGSLLPEYRGASPIQSVFLDQKSESGITIMKMEAWLDTGPMIDKLKVELKFGWTAKDLIAWMQSQWPKFLNKVLRKYGKKMLGEVAQDNNKATHCGKIQKEDGQIDIYKTSLEDVWKKYKAYVLRPKIYFFWDETLTNAKWKRIVVETLNLNQDLYNKNKHKAMISLYSDQDKTKIWKLKLNPAITALYIKAEGKKKIAWNDFLKGAIH